MLVSLATTACLLGPAQGLDRPYDPVILTGEELPGLIGVDVVELVAWSWNGSWVQVPVQVDERKLVAFDQAYGAFDPQTALTVLTYADPSTHVGADGDPAFDDDDELVVMAADAGTPAPIGAGLPPGVLAGSGLELSLFDPLDSGAGTLYLFRSLGGLDPSAGEDRVSYQFSLLSGDYLGTYSQLQGPNPEASTVTSALYSTRFVDRWRRDELRILAGGASGVDLLDNEFYVFRPGTCVRTEVTFSQGQGAFLANIDGPLRGIRSFLGANSGVLSQRTHFFFEGREEVVSTQRVHSLNFGGLFALDFAPEAIGMSYWNSELGAPVPVDGQPDGVPAGPHDWALLSGGQGSLAVAQWLETDIPNLVLETWYSDDLTPLFSPCTGDAVQYGSTGLRVVSPLPNTDPRNPPSKRFQVRRAHHYEGPGMGPADAALRSDQARTPLVVSVAPFGAEVGSSYCSATDSSAGGPGVLEATGSTSLGAADLALACSDLPPMGFGYFLMSRDQAFVPLFGGSQGNLCLGTPLYRFASNVLNSGATGQVSLAIDYGALPQGQQFQAGESWSFQYWFRDLNPGPTSNTTQGLELVFIP